MNIPGIRCFIPGVILLLLLSMLLLPASPASGQAKADQVTFTQQDLDRDGKPDVTVIDRLFASDHDRISVYDRTGNMAVSHELTQAVDFTDDVWIFDAHADGAAELIITFYATQQSEGAYIYDDSNGDMSVSYERVGKEIHITENANWHLKVEAKPTFILSDGSVNPDVHIWIDGYVMRFLEWGEGQPSGDYIKENWITDGVVDWEQEIVDSDGNGISNYQLEHLLRPEPGYSVFKSTLYVNETLQKPSLYPNYIFWPLLVSKHDYEKYRYFDHPPVVSMDWDIAKIDRVGILGYPIEKGYHINGREYWEKGKVNYASFENPMAYYDLANDHDGKPELFARFEVFKPFDPFFPNNEYMGASPSPAVQIDYSWDQNNDGKWDYKLDLAGRYSIDSVVPYKDFGLLSIPYVEIPGWIKSHSWDIAMLIQSDIGEANSEGMGPWNVNRGYENGEDIEPSKLRDLYMLGLTNTPPSEQYQDITTGYRGEYRFHYGQTPRLYFSSVDHKLHLINAESGVWNIGDSQRIRYANLDRDAYLDQWQKQYDGVLVQQLNYCQGILLYSGNDRFRLKQINTPPALFETQPPGTNNEYMNLGKKLDANKAKFSLDDLDAMLEQYGDADVSIQGASLRDFRITQGGFRFILKLQKGFRFQGEDRLGVNGKSPGEYVVRYDGTFHLQPLTPPSLQIQFLQKSSENSTSTYLSTNLQIVLSNTGLEDAHQVSVSLGMAQPGHAVEWAEPQIVTVFAGESTTISIPWVPTSPGAWEVLAKAEIVDSGSPAVTARQTINAAPAQGTTLQQDLTAFGLITPTQVIALMMTVITLGGFTGWFLVQYLKKDAGGNTN